MTSIVNDASITEPVLANSHLSATDRYKLLMALAFSTIFQTIALLLIGFSIFQFFTHDLNNADAFISAVVKCINTLVISLAMFELGAGVSKEYSSPSEESNIFVNIRRTITRFVGTICIALVLEALIMIIKYSQLDLAGNLYYPVGILFGGSMLLIALGTFLRLTHGQTE
ncbi:MAG TPA: hypothetical protein VIQ03_16050 [Gammaproteobacteria bacterium]